MAPKDDTAQLVAEARYAADRVALYEQRMYAGSGDPRRLAELQRIAAGAADRLTRHRRAEESRAHDEPAVEPGLAQALREVTDQLDAPDLDAGERMRLLQRQAELGDLRDEIALRARRGAGQRT